ncbi:MAG TPA: HD domain-containing protein [Flavitalea sp.]|nr:HD domain-containing protein [Flavitalea sp.]
MKFNYIVLSNNIFMSTIGFESIETAVLKKLETLSPGLTYHSREHTRDVVRQSARIAREESITDTRKLFILKIAALYHDTGFIDTYSNHEERSCQIFLRDSVSFGLTPAEIREITELIMVTRIPQQPKNLLQRILCDADLDYLGREDFESIGEKLRQEFLLYGVVQDDEEWDQLQLKFLTNHKYHTASSQRDREPVKQLHLHSLIR